MFTDIEGSTQRWDRGRDAMQEALRRHDELMRSALARHKGHVFKAIGDAFCAVFAGELAVLYGAQGRVAEAEALFTRARRAGATVSS